MATGLLMCLYRSIERDPFLSALRLLTSPRSVEYGWRLDVNGEAGINRSRSVLASRWYQQAASDVFLMLDDDIVYEPEHAEHIVDLCANGHDIICGAYPTRDASHLALRALETNAAPTLAFGKGHAPLEIRWAPTGFLAVHRRVVDAMVQTMPLCHTNSAQPYWPLFGNAVMQDDVSGGWNELSEDWLFSERARALGYKVWLDPSVILGHLATVTLHVGNMNAIYQATNS